MTSLPTPTGPEPFRPGLAGSVESAIPRIEPLIARSDRQSFGDVHEPVVVIRPPTSRTTLARYAMQAAAAGSAEPSPESTPATPSPGFTDMADMTHDTAETESPPVAVLSTDSPETTVSNVQKNEVLPDAVDAEPNNDKLAHDWRKIGGDVRARAIAAGMTNLQIAELSGLAEGVVRAFLYGHRLVDASNVSIIAEAVGYTEAEQAVLAGQYTSAIRIRRQADIQSGKLMDDGIYAPASAAEAFLVAMKLGLPVSDIDVGQNPSAQTVLNVLREKPTTTPTTIARRHGLSAKEVRDALELVTERILDMYPALEPFIQRLRREDDPDGSRPLTGKGEVLPEVRAAYQAFGIDVDTLPVSLRKSAPELEQLPELVALAASDSDPQTILTGLSAAIPKGRTLRHYAPGSLVDDEVDNLLLDPALSNPDIVRISGLPLRSVNTLRKRMTAELARRITDVRTTGVHSAAAHDLSEPLDATAPSKIAQMAVYMKRYEIPLAGIFTVRQLAMYRMCIDPRMSREMLMERLRMTSEQFDTLESQFVEKMTLALQARLRGEL